MEDYQFRIIDGDDHVILLEDNTTIKVGQLREELTQQYQLLALQQIDYGRLSLPVSKYVKNRSFTGLFTSVRWKSWPSEGINCEILFLGSSSWYKGKFRVTANIDCSSNLEKISIDVLKSYGQDMAKITTFLAEKELTWDDLYKIKITLEFASENPNFFLPEMPESPLEEIRQQMREQENRERENKLSI